jgi:hypothetical protein
MILIRFETVTRAEANNYIAREFAKYFLGTEREREKAGIWPFRNLFFGSTDVLSVDILLH